MMDYHELIDALTDEGNPNVLDYIDDAVEMLEHLYSELKAANARCETLSKMVTQYQDELIPGYRERAEKAEFRSWLRLAGKMQFTLALAGSASITRWTNSAVVLIG